MIQRKGSLHVIVVKPRADTPGIRESGGWLGFQSLFRVAGEGQEQVYNQAPCD